MTKLHGIVFALKRQNITWTRENYPLANIARVINNIYMR